MNFIAFFADLFWDSDLIRGGEVYKSYARRIRTGNCHVRSLSFAEDRDNNNDLNIDDEKGWK